MMRCVLVMLCAAALSQGRGALASDLGDSFPLTTAATEETEPASDWWQTSLQEVSDRRLPAERRFYISGMLGPSFASFTDRALDTNDSILAAGGSLGCAFERARGRLRVEAEGIGRDTYFGSGSNLNPDAGLFAYNNWSVMGNIWRDLTLTDRLGVYGGGGLGAGGYRYAVGSRTFNRVYADESGSAFAWQVGGGILYEITDRLTFDAGYRYYHVDTIVAPLTVPPLSFSKPTDFASNELMFTLRFYEPFRGWTR